MTVTIFLPPTIEAKLRSHAALTGKDVSALVAEAVEQQFGDAAVIHQQSAIDFDHALEEFFSANRETVSPLPR
jgi:hypothetical protein